MNQAEGLFRNPTKIRGCAIDIALRALFPNMCWERDSYLSVLHLAFYEIVGRLRVVMGTRVYIGRVPYRATERDVEHFFRGYGRILEVILKNGYGFIEFADYRDADDAVHDLNGRELMGDRVHVELAKGTPRGRDDGFRDRDRRGYRERSRDRFDRGWGGGGGRDFGRYGRARRRETGRNERTDYRLVVENLSSRVSWQDLKDYMRTAGEVTYTDAHGKRKNEGLVEFATKSDMKNAIEKLSGKEFSGRKIKLIEERKRKSRSRSYSRSRSGTRSRSRSRSGSGSRKSKSKSRSRSRSESKERNGKSEDEEESRKRSKRSRKHSSRSRSKSAEKEKKERDSRSRSKSKSPKEDEGEGKPNGEEETDDKAEKGSRSRSKSGSGSPADREGSSSPKAKRARNESEASKEGEEAEAEGRKSEEEKD